MKLLMRLNDPVSLQVLCDALEDQHIPFRVDHAGMNALMPLPGVMEARVLVDEERFEAASSVVADLGLEP